LTDWAPVEIVIADDGALRLVDSDTIDYAGNRYRLAGFDAPESRSSSETEMRLVRLACFRLGRLLKPHQDRRLYPIGKRDQCGRIVAKLVVNSEDVAAIAVCEGWGFACLKGKRARWSNPEVLAAHAKRMKLRDAEPESAT
jgi:endonuclease YncB( thermonuclease family)